MIWGMAADQARAMTDTPPLQPAAAQSSIEDAISRIKADFGNGPESKEAAADFIRGHLQELSRCILPELFFKAAEKAEPDVLATDTYEKLLTCTLPEDLQMGILDKLAWYYYNRGDTSRAELLFTRLQKENPGNSDAALGLGYIRLNSGRAAEALAILKASGVADTDKVRELKRLVYIRLGWEKYDGGDFDSAVAFARQALAIRPDDPDALVLEGWGALKRGESDLALGDFETLVKLEPSSKNLTQLMDAQLFANHYRDARKTAGIMAASKSPELHQRAADFFFQHKEPIRAARILEPDISTCYQNADTLQIQLESYIRHRDGDTGTSRLDEYALPLEVQIPMESGLRLSVGLTSKRIGSGNGRIPALSGSYYHYLDDESLQTDQLKDKTVAIPQVGIFSEGETRWSIRLGTTPLNGTVSATPTGEIRLETDRWHLAVHRYSVTESVLSTIGLEDPYTDRTWGRVVRSGIAAGATKTLGKTYWVSVSAGADLYTGHNIRKNSRVDGNLSAGGTWQYRNGSSLSSGLFFYAQHFKRNSDFFTFGHGGYYSPDLMTMLGPFANYRSPTCRKWQFDFQGSMGWLHEKTADSPRYPLFTRNSSLLGAEAEEEAQGTYQGLTNDDLGYSLSAEGWYFFTDRIALGGVLKGEKSTNHGEFLAAIGLKWFFQPQAGFWKTPFTLTQIGGDWNR